MKRQHENKFLPTIKEGIASWTVLCGLETAYLRGQSITADNRKINANFKKGGFIGYQTFAHLMKCVHDKKNATEESGKNLYLFVAFFLTNSIASYPPFFKLRLSLMRKSIQAGRKQ